MKGRKKLDVPNFLCVGAPKAGTTSLYMYLQQHPDIFMSTKKEPRFFCSAYYKTLNQKDPRWFQSTSTVIYREADYLKLFDTSENEKVVGEASVQYLYLHTLAIPKIKKYIGDPKILIMLRNPIDRCVSSYLRARRDGFEKESFCSSLHDEEYKIRNNWSLGHFHKSLGLYFEATKQYLDNFTNVKVVIYDDYKESPANVTRDIYEFLGVDKSFLPNCGINYNASGIPLSRTFHNLIIRQSYLRNLLLSLLRMMLSETQIRNLREIMINLNMRGVELSLTEDELADLRCIYEDEINQLSNLLNRNLSHWLK